MMMPLRVSPLEAWRKVMPMLSRLLGWMQSKFWLGRELGWLNKDQVPYSGNLKAGTPRHP